MMPWFERFHFPSRPDPTDALKPYHIYDRVALESWDPRLSNAPALGG